MQRITWVILITTTAFIAGCGSTKALAPPISIVSSAPMELPYSKSLDDAKAEVRSAVDSLMIDETAIAYRDREIAKLGTDGAFTLNDTMENRRSIATGTFKDALRGLLARERAGIFTLTKMSSSLRPNGNTDHATFTVSGDGTSGTVSGNMRIGENFCWDDGHDRTCYQQESYDYKLDGTWDAGGRDLLLKYTLTQEKHITQFSLDSKLDQEALVRVLRGLAEAGVAASRKDVDQRGKDAVRTAVRTISGTLANRLDIRPDKEIQIAERLYQVGFETAVGRLQRQLGTYKYDSKNSTFSFTDTLSLQLLGLQHYSQIVFTVKLFPERAATAVVYELKYTPIDDRLTNRQVFTEADAIERVSAHMDKIKGLLTK